MVVYIKQQMLAFFKKNRFNKKKNVLSECDSLKKIHLKWWEINFEDLFALRKP